LELRFRERPLLVHAGECLLQNLHARFGLSRARQDLTEEICLGCALGALFRELGLEIGNSP
jgi:hypothetical protein